jgi:hypothetical protein
VKVETKLLALGGVGVALIVVIVAAESAMKPKAVEEPAPSADEVTAERKHNDEVAATKRAERESIEHARTAQQAPIDLRTNDGCAPVQNDQLILSEAGTRRDKFADGIGQLVGDLANGFMLGAGGCDATDLNITLMEGGNAACDEGRIRALREQIAPSLRRQGFKRIRCYPDGPMLDVGL